MKRLTIILCLLLATEGLHAQKQLISKAVILKTVFVTSIPALKTALANDSNDVIILANGTYIVPNSAAQTATALWIDDEYAARTRPVLVKAETRYGVTFDGDSVDYWQALAFVGGAHHQTWDGFNFTNGHPTACEVIDFNGYTSDATIALAAHHITIQYCKISGVWGSSKAPENPPNDHAIYVSLSTGGANNLVFDNIVVEDSVFDGLGTAFHFYHSGGGYVNAHDVEITNCTIYGTQTPIILWDGTLQNIHISNTTIIDPMLSAIRYEGSGTATGIIFNTVVSSGSSGGVGFSSSEGANPPGVTFINCDLK